MFSFRIEAFSRMISSKLIEILQFVSAVVFFFFHVGDIATDVISCVSYYNNGYDAYYKATLAFLIVPFVYVVYLGPAEVGGLEGVPMCTGYGYTLLSYFTGPLFPYVVNGKLSDTNVRKVEGISIFGSGYMEDVPQVIIAVFFVFSGYNKNATANEKLIALVQLGFSALSGVYKMFNGARKLGDGRVDCCGRTFRC